MANISNSPQLKNITPPPPISNTIQTQSFRAISKVFFLHIYFVILVLIKLKIMKGYGIIEKHF